MASVRPGKHFELELDAEGPDALALADKIAATLLANPVIEDFTVQVRDDR